MENRLNILIIECKTENNFPENILIGFEDKNETNKLIWNTVAQLLTWEMWKLRNVIKYEGKRISSLKLIESEQKKIRNACRFWEKTNIASKYPELVHILKMMI